MAGARLQRQVSSSGFGKDLAGKCSDFRATVLLLGNEDGRSRSSMHWGSEQLAPAAIGAVQQWQRLL